MNFRSALNLLVLTLMACAMWEKGTAYDCPKFCLPQKLAQKKCEKFEGCRTLPCDFGIKPKGKYEKLQCVPISVVLEFLPEENLINVECPPLGFQDFIGDVFPLASVDCFFPCLESKILALDDACIGGDLDAFTTVLDTVGAECCETVCGEIYFSDDLGRCCAAA